MGTGFLAKEIFRYFHLLQLFINTLWTGHTTVTDKSNMMIFFFLPNHKYSKLYILIQLRVPVTLIWGSQVLLWLQILIPNYKKQGITGSVINFFWYFNMYSPHMWQNISGLLMQLWNYQINFICDWEIAFLWIRPQNNKKWKYVVN